MSKQQLHQVSFDLIRYANCWEDADVLLKGLGAGPGARILSICSAGDNSFSLLTTGADLVVAADVNRLQLHLAELKIAAFKALEYPEFLSFLGFAPCSNRIMLFAKVKAFLSDEALQYWERHLRVLQAGAIFAGKFERYFAFFRKMILPLVHSRDRIEWLFADKPAWEQEEFYAQEWNNLRWKMLFKLFFNKYVMGRYGRDAEFLKHVKVPVSQFIFGKAEKHLSSINAQKNYFLRFIHAGTFGTMLPHYARRENFNEIRKNIGKLVLFEGFAEAALGTYTGITHMNLSNIFEYMDMETFRQASQKLAGSLSPQGRMAYWNLMVPRRASEQHAEMSYKRDLSEQLSEIDKGFFYNRFIVDEKL